MAQDNAGLFGSDLTQRTLTPVVAEFIGTFILVFSITATVAAAALQDSPPGSAYDALSIVLVNGLTLAALATALGHVSGGHLNPAVTIGLAVTRHFPWRLTGFYLVAQFAGAICAALATLAFFGTSAITHGHLGAPGPQIGESALQVMGVKALATFILVFVVLAAATDARSPDGAAPLAIGFALAAAVFVSLPLTGAGVNPARALGPMIVSGHFTAAWAYVVGPLIGGVAASVIYDRFLRRADIPE